MGWQSPERNHDVIGRRVRGSHGVLVHLLMSFALASFGWNWLGSSDHVVRDGFRVVDPQFHVQQVRCPPVLDHLLQLLIQCFFCWFALL